MLGTALLLSALLTALGLPGCGRSGDRQVVSRDAYVAAYVELLLARDGAADSAAAAESTRAALQRHGLTSQQLRAFNERYADDPGYLADVWLEIERRLRNPEAADTAAVER